MPHFFIKSDNIKSDYVTINDKDTVKHLCASLRVKCGESLKFIDENEIQYETTLCNVTKTQIQAKIERSYSSKRKLDYPLYLAAAILKPDAQALLISGAAQCGVEAIYPIMSDNCAVSKKSLEAKTDKWQKISNEASKQCERANFAKVCDIGTFESVLAGIKTQNILIYAEKYANLSINEAISDVDKTSPIVVVTGPEGGFSEREFKYFLDNNYKLITLGNLIFKAPNAAVAGISNIVTRL